MEDREERLTPIIWGYSKRCHFILTAMEDEAPEEPPNRIGVDICKRCSRDMIRNDSGYSCTRCGIHIEVFDAQPCFIENIWMKVASSSYSRTKHFETTVARYVHQDHVSTLSADFSCVARKIEELRVGKSNISRYSFYIIRLCSRRGLEVNAVDIKSAARVRELEDELFGKVYQRLGWEPYHCRYYSEWCARHSTEGEVGTD